MNRIRNPELWNPKSGSSINARAVGGSAEEEWRRRAAGAADTEQLHDTRSAANWKRPGKTPRAPAT